MTFLLDVNVLIALLDPAHASFTVARDWFKSTGKTSWATCPITENGVIRIVGRPSYPNTPGPPAIVAEILRNLCALPGHEFWPDSISLLDGRYFEAAKIGTPRDMTDIYLLALAATHEGRLATFDRRLSTNGVVGGRRALCVIG